MDGVRGGRGTFVSIATKRVKIADRVHGHKLLGLHSSCDCVSHSSASIYGNSQT